MYDKNNIFAKIIIGHLPSTKIYEDEHLVVIHDLHPKAPVHVLVLPKGEYVDYDDFVNKASKEQICHFFKKIPEIVNMLQLDNYRLIINKGAQSGQIIFHFHVHILGGTDLDRAAS